MSDPDSIAHFRHGGGAVIAAAIHDGHRVRPEVAALLALDETARLREEDPFTGLWARLSPSHIVGLHSRFEVDLNRPREGAVYLAPEQAWGLAVWKYPPPRDLVEHSLARYDAFYRELRSMLDEQAARHRRFVVYDIHSYNHRRDGPEAPPGDPATNPEINLGTGSMDRARWAPLVDRFLGDLRAGDPVARRAFDVRENIRFRGGYFAGWIHEHYPEAACVLSIEVKKFFMDEWSGKPYPEEIQAVGAALAATVPGVLEELGHLGAND